jgi:polyisoprenoid-binding protein YceI
LDAADGELTVTTGVTGPAAKMGHRLTIAMTSWQAAVQWVDGAPAQVVMTVDVDSLEVRRGDGGVKGLSGPEKALVRSNALSVFDASRFEHIQFQADDIAPTDGGYQLTGRLTMHGRERRCAVELRVEDLGDTWRMSAQAEVRHSEFGMKPYSMMMGAMKVTDAVTVAFAAERAKN